MFVVRGAKAPPSLFDEAAQSAPSSVSGKRSAGELQKFEDYIALQGEARDVVTGAQATSSSSASAASTATSIRSSAAATSAAGLQAQVVQRELIDPAIWQAGITLAACSGKGSATTPTAPSPTKVATWSTASGWWKSGLEYSEFFPLN